MVKNLPAKAGDIRDWVQSPGWEDLLEKDMATHSSILAWRIPWTEEPTAHRVTQSWTRLKQVSMHARKRWTAAGPHWALPHMGAHCALPLLLVPQFIPRVLPGLLM